MEFHILQCSEIRKKFSSTLNMEQYFPLKRRCVSTSLNDVSTQKTGGGGENSGQYKKYLKSHETKWPLKFIGASY
jgi:hypothetical protein